jgi:hypothetical protein
MAQSCKDKVCLGGGAGKGGVCAHRTLVGQGEGGAHEAVGMRHMHTLLCTVSVAACVFPAVVSARISCILTVTASAACRSLR